MVDTVDFKIGCGVDAFEGEHLVLKAALRTIIPQIELFLIAMEPSEAVSLASSMMTTICAEINMPQDYFEMMLDSLKVAYRKGAPIHHALRDGVKGTA